MKYRSLIVAAGAVLLLALWGGLGFSSSIKPPILQATTVVKKSKTPTVAVTATPSRTATLMPTATETPAPTATDTLGPTTTETLASTLTDTPTPTSTGTSAPTATDTALPTPTWTAIPISTPTPGATIAPYPNAPLCPDVGAGHDYTRWHGLWDSVRGCHYDHEHGENAFTPEVAAAFPGFDLFTLLCFHQVGSCDPSSPIENLTKHGGMKWQVQPQTPHGCNNVGPDGPFEGAQYGVDGMVVEYHAFGDYSIEFEARIHSASILLRECSVTNPSDKGYLFVSQFEDYGEACVPYQGDTMPYPNSFQPPYNCASGPYMTNDCVGVKAAGQLAACRPSLDFIRSHNVNTNSIWTSKRTGIGDRPMVSAIFRLLFRVRDVYNLFDWSDQTYPFSFLWVCSSDGGLTYNGHMAGCRWNNSTTRVHEVAGTIPAGWDNLEGFDTDPQVGRITAQGFVTRFGDLNLDCSVPDPAADCFPILMLRAFVGTYGDETTAIKVSNPDAVSNPERDFCFTSAGALIGCDQPGAIPSGWIGVSN